MKRVVIIPARYEATRLPGKPLLAETGKYLIQHVWEQARKARTIDHVIVATDDARIQRAVESFGGDCRLTRSDHPSGTDRIAEVASHLDAHVIVNVQGDEPNIDPATIDRVADGIAGDVPMATAAAVIRRPEDLADPNKVKVVLDADGCALYFSRAPIPFDRDGAADFAADSPYLWHMGIYAYERSFLLGYRDLPPSRLEAIEKLEQLRALSAGRRIKVIVLERPSLGIDTPEDYERFVSEYGETGTPS